MKVLFIFLFFFLLFSPLKIAKASDPLFVIGEEENLSRQLSSHYGSQTLDEELVESVQHFDEIIPRLPGVMSAGGTSRSRFFQIRGIGERSSYEGMPNESVTILFDEIDYTGVGGVLETFGVENFEIYKGPQNTVVGPSALAGAFRAHTSSSTSNDFKSKATIESFNGRSLGLEKKHKFRKGGITLVSNLRESDGFFRNRFLGREDTNNIQEFSFRTKATYENITLNLHYFNFDNGYDVFNLNNSKETQSDNPGSDIQKTLGMSIIHELKEERWKLKSILSGHRTGTFYAYDEDWGNSNSYNYRIGFDKDLNNVNLEERLSWEYGSLINTTGVFFKNNHLSTRELGFNTEVPRKDLKSTFKRRRLAVFHESEYLLTNVSLFGGIRISHLNSNYLDSNTISLSPKEALFGGHFGLKKETGQNLWSVRLSRGFKAGGINIGSNISSNRREFKEESLYQFDLNWKKDSELYSIDLNLFGNYRNNIQVKTSYQDNPSDPSSFTFYTDNGTSGYSYGGEGRITLKPKPTYELAISGNLMDSRYEDYVYGTRNLKGREFSYAPNYKLIIGHNFKLLKNYYLKWENIFTDSFYFGNSHDEASPKSITTNLSLGWRLKNIHLTLWARNLFQERTETRGFFFGNRPPSFGNERFVQVGSPRVLGISLEGSF